MPFKKFQDQEGLASISRALASRKSQVLEGKDGESARYEKKLETKEDSSKKRRRKIEDRAAEVDQAPLQSAPSPKQSLSKASAGGENTQNGLSIQEHRNNSKMKKKRRVHVKNSGGLFEQVVPAEHDGHQETPSELHTLAVQDLEHPLQSSQFVAEQKSFRDIYVQSFTSAFSTDLYSLQQAEGAPWQLEDAQAFASMIFRIAGPACMVQDSQPRSRRTSGLLKKSG
ncbi:g8011 [Coccomyxa elongata]